MTTIIIRIIGLYLNVLALIAPQKAGRKGFMLFCRPFRVAISEKQKRFLDTAEKFMLHHEGHNTQVYKWGNGPKKILFLHGWQSHTYRWKAYIEALQGEEYSIYSIDAPGHGLSEGEFLSVPLYSSLVEKFVKEYGPFHNVTAHSLGGFTLLYALYRLPLLPINKVILLAPPGNANDFLSVFKDTLKLSGRTIDLVLKHFVSRYEVKPDYFSASKFAENLNVSGLIIHDEEDREAPFHYSIPLRQTWKKSELIVTKGLGHNLRSPQIVKHVVDFIDQPVRHYSVY